MKFRTYGWALTWLLVSSRVFAGVSAYLPINIDSAMERQIERVLILADEPILKRPFPVALVELALPKACEVDEPLCKSVKSYLLRYSHDYGVAYASASGAKARQGSTAVVANEYGMPVTSRWELAGQAYVQPNDYLLATVGGVAYSGRATPTGTLLSFGTNWGQIDLGYRAHWFSPATDSSQLISTEAPTLPSITVSNYEPIGRLGFQYEFFLSRLSQSNNNILYLGKTSTGSPRIFGMQFSIEPFSGWSLGFNRLLEYGGGSGLPQSSRILLRNIFKPSGLAQTQGNQQASYISRFIFPGKTPFALYAQYAGEDNSNGGSYLLGNAALTVGIDIPKIAHYFDVTYEVSEWQNIWYVHNIFLDGMSNDGLVLGNWGADQRQFGDGVGARSQMLRVGWVPAFGGYLEERVRTLVNQNYYGGDSRSYLPIPPFSYHRYRDFSIRYSRPWKGLNVGGELFGGRDIFGKSFARISGFVNYGGDERSREDGSSAGGSDDELDATGKPERGAEVFVDFGGNATKVRENVEPNLPVLVSKLAVGPHIGFGARRQVAENNDLGARIEVDEVNHHSLVGVRALDYRHRYNEIFALSVFAGAARYGLATPAYSVYAGVGGQWRNIAPKWDLNLDLRYGQNLARDHVLASDVQGIRAESFFKIESAVLYLSKRF